MRFDRMCEDITDGYVFHNTRSEFLPAIRREGLTAGTFSDRPVAFGGDVWLAVRVSDLPPLASHSYGGRIAYEPRQRVREAEAGPGEGRAAQLQGRPVRPLDCVRPDR